MTIAAAGGLYPARLLAQSMLLSNTCWRRLASHLRVAEHQHGEDGPAYPIKLATGDPAALAQHG